MTGHIFKLKLAVGVGKVLAFVIATYALLQLVVFTGLGTVSARYWSRYDGRGLNEPWFLASSIGSLAVVLLVCFGFLRYVEKRGWSHVGLHRRRALRLFGAGTLVSTVAVGLIVAIAIGAGAVTLTGTSASLTRGVLYLLLMLIGGLCLVVQEEIIFRGYVLRTLDMYGNAPVAVVGTALLFGLAHLTRAHVSVLGILNISLMGGFLALVCLKAKSLWPTIGLHFGWNALLYIFDFPVSGARHPNFLLDLQAERPNLLTGSAFGPEDSLLVTGLMMALLAAALVWHPTDRLKGPAVDIRPGTVLQ
ncbi:MAG: CPBP family intramembrane glutamic endopeptidase [Candidatus Zixiibacteriota bacterium]